MWGRLKQKWGISSDAQMTIIFIVFAITGSASVWVRKPVMAQLGADTLPAYIRIPLGVLLIFPIYQVLLITIGSIAGQYKFFLRFLKKMWRIKETN